MGLSYIIMGFSFVFLLKKERGKIEIFQVSLGQNFGHNYKGHTPKLD